MRPRAGTRRPARADLEPARRTHRLGPPARRAHRLPRDHHLDSPFGPAQTRDFGWTHQLGLDRLLDLVASRSYVILLSAAQRAELLDRVRDFTTTHPDLAGRDTFALPYVTHCVRADLPPRH